MASAKKRKARGDNEENESVARQARETADLNRPMWLCDIAAAVHRLVKRYKARSRFQRMIRKWQRERKKSVPADASYRIGDDKSCGVEPLYVGPKMTVSAKYATLAAIHDHCLSEIESREMEAVRPLNPWDGCPDTEWNDAIPFVVLRDERIPNLDESVHRDRLYRIVSDVEKDLGKQQGEKETDEAILRHADIDQAATADEENCRSMPVAVRDRAPKADRPDDGKPAASSKQIKRPSENAFKVWRLRDATGINNQTRLAEKMTEMGCPATQGQVSRWLQQVESYLREGNVLPVMEPPTQKPIPIDPSHIDRGARLDGRTERQRPKRDPDSLDS